VKKTLFTRSIYYQIWIGLDWVCNNGPMFNTAAHIAGWHTIRTVACIHGNWRFVS